ncbi:hypothetical protein [Methanoregula sp. UBA64]|uniref:hypothetical protein n=1 Tax=Methanoregula sp. UBA64 TaxID=1915554 RepID=UPI0025FD4989|nr:hypothetical protein [Methanoregula sp. UBA64]
MKNAAKFLLIPGILLIVCILCAGCSSSSGTTDTPTTATPAVTTTTAAALYSAGDIVKSASASSGTAWLITGYDPDADTYTRAFVYQNTDGSWGYRMNSETQTTGRAALEKMYPVKVTSVTVSAVPIKSAAAASATTASSVTAATTTTAGTTATTVAPKPLFKDMIPDQGNAGTTVAITDLVGSGFQSGASVQLVKSGTSINATSVVLVSSSHMTCAFAIPSNTPSGTWDVVITNPDGQSVTYSTYFTVHGSTSAASTTSTTTTVAGSSFTITSVTTSPTAVGGSTGWTGILTIVTSKAVQPGTGLVVSLSKSGYNTIYVYNPPVSTSGTTITAQVSQPVYSGSWDVKVTNPDGSFGVLTNGLSVT